jgi:tetratricopeptide (TPR) repeat protein
MTWRTAVRNTDWADNIPLAISTARDNPASGKACSWAGAILLLSDNPEYVAFGKTLLERGIELSPDYVNARWEIAKFHGLRNQLGESAIRVAQAARVDPGTAITRTALPAVVQDLKRADPASYMPVIEGYYREHPGEDAANLALALAFHGQGDLDQAQQYTRRALDLAGAAHPFHEAGAELAAILFERGAKDGDRTAISAGLDKFRLYLHNLPNSVEGRLAMAAMLLSLDARQYPGSTAEAQANISLARALDTGNPRVRELQGRLNARARSLAESNSTAVALPDFKTDPLPIRGVGP